MALMPDLSSAGAAEVAGEGAQAASGAQEARAEMAMCLHPRTALLAWPLPRTLARAAGEGAQGGPGEAPLASEALAGLAARGGSGFFTQARRR